MTFIYSDEILKEFIRLANQQDPSVKVDFDKSQFDLIPDINNDLVVDGQPTFVTAAIVSSAEDDRKTILEKRYPVEPEDLVEKAHPEPVMVADHPVGGLVENQNEQHQRMLNVVNKMPTGFPLHSWATISVELIKIAQECDDLGLETEAQAIDDIVTSINKEAGVLSFLGGGLGSVIKKLLGPTAIAILPFLNNPITVGIAAALAVGSATFWTLWDGKREGLTIDIDDLIDELNDYKSDSDFAGLPGFQQMYDAANKLKQIHAALMVALSDRAATQNAETIAKVSQLYNAAMTQLDILKTNFPLFEAAAPKNVARQIVGFENIRGRIDDLEEQYAELGSAANVSRTEAPGAAGEHNEHDKVAPQKEVAPAAKVEDIKRFLREHDVSELVGYQYEVDDSPELDANTRRILSDMGDHIRQQLGTRTPTTKELINSSYDGLEKLMQIYHEPWNFAK